MFNIALVSQIFWSYIVEILSGDASPKGYEYYIGFAIIIVGIYLFHKYPVIELKAIDRDITDESINKDERTKTLISNMSETSSCSAFSPHSDKFLHLKNNTLSLKANKYLNNE